MHKIARDDILVMYIAGPPEEVQPDLWDGGTDTLLKADLYTDKEYGIYPYVEILRPVPNCGYRRLAPTDCTVFALGALSYDDVLTADPEPLAARIREEHLSFLESFVVNRAQHFMTRLRSNQGMLPSDKWIRHGNLYDVPTPATIWHDIVREFAAQLPRPMTEHRPMTFEETAALDALEALEAAGDK